MKAVPKACFLFEKASSCLSPGRIWSIIKKYAWYFRNGSLYCFSNRDD